MSFSIFSNKENVKVSSIEDLKALHRKDKKLRNFKYISIFVFFVLWLFLFQEKIASTLILLCIIASFYLFIFAISIRSISKLPHIDEVSEGSTGNFSRNEIVKVVDDVRLLLNTKREFDIRIIPDIQSQASTTLERYKKFFKNKNILVFHEGLLRTLSKPELKAVIAHEIGHHLSPVNISNILSEYWADFFACKYFDPVAMANALIKLDQNNFLLNVFIQRCNHVANSLINPKFINQEFWEFIIHNVPIPFKSKRKANRLAKNIVLKYMNENNFPKYKRNFVSRLYFLIKSKYSGDILNRRKLSEIRYICWSSYDTRIKDNYLDKYELIEMFNVIKNKNMTINRLFFFDNNGASHPNTNRRLIFIIENFLLVDDYSYERLFNTALENKLKYNLVNSADAKNRAAD